MAFAHESRASVGSPNMSIGLNWMIQHAGVETIIWHNGGTGGYRTFLGLDQSKKDSSRRADQLGRSGAGRYRDASSRSDNPARTETGSAEGADRDRTAGHDRMSRYVGCLSARTESRSGDHAERWGALYAADGAGDPAPLAGDRNGLLPEGTRRSGDVRTRRAGSGDRTDLSSERPERSRKEIRQHERS